MATKNVYIAVTQGSIVYDFVIKGNPESYTAIAGVTDSGFTAKEADDADLAKVLGVVVPIVALLESGSFKRMKAREKTGKKSREFIVPSASITKVTAAIESSAGLTIDGINCGSVSSGLRRVSR